MSNDLLVLEKEIVRPEKPTFMIAGFNQWANAGNVSSGIPEYLIEKLKARKIGHIRKGDFYIFQLPGSHFLFRPSLKYVEGYEEHYEEEPVNDFYYAEIDDKALIVFIGTEPNQREDVYVNTLLDGATELGVKRIVIPAGVGGEVPFDRERLVSCNYSLKHMQEELKDYAVTFSNYGRNATIGMVITHHCKERNIESVRLSARTPSYQLQLTIPSDKKAIYDILRRIRYMFGIDLDLSDLERESKQQNSDFQNALKRLCVENPELEPQVTDYMEQVEKEFKELRFNEPTKIPDIFLKEFDSH
ncbi:MAG: PAC2 family protein [Dehalococcoidales bacterium]|nr:MAG: PAC2 family protein [Dehalococcoidales bacterium]